HLLLAEGRNRGTPMRRPTARSTSDSSEDVPLRSSATKTSRDPRPRKQAHSSPRSTPGTLRNPVRHGNYHPSHPGESKDKTCREPPPSWPDARPPSRELGDGSGTKR